MCQPSGLSSSQLVRKPVVITTGRGCASPSGLKLKERQAKIQAMIVTRHQALPLPTAFHWVHPNREQQLDATNNSPIETSYLFFGSPSGSFRSEPAFASFGSFQLCAPPRQARRKRKRASGGHGSFQLCAPPRQVRRKRKRAGGGHGSF